MKKVSYHTPTTMDSFKDMVPPHPHVWEWMTQHKDGEVHIIEETCLPEHHKYDGRIKIACIIETPAIYNACKLSNPSIFDPFAWIKNNHHHFAYVMSPYKFLKDIVGDKYLYVPVGGSRIEPESVGMYEKQRLLSIVASHKNWTDGHRLRHLAINRFPGKIDIYGSGYNNIINEFNGNMGKIISLAPYYFTLAIINSTYDDFFTEVITDAFAVGTVPIWWGTANIGKYFNADGIIQFRTIEELDKIIPTLTPELYESKRKSIEENIELSKKYTNYFNWIFDNYKEKFESL